MRAKLLFLGLICTLIACTKDKFQSKPQLELKRVNPTTLNPNNFITFDFVVTDSEGDIQDTLYIQKIVPGCTNSSYSLKYKMPNFAATKNLKADVEVTFFHGLAPGYVAIGDPQCNRNDTCTFKFWLKDKANNRSDTVTISNIVIVRR